MTEDEFVTRLRDVCRFPGTATDLAALVVAIEPIPEHRDLLKPIAVEILRTYYGKR